MNTLQLTTLINTLANVIACNINSEELDLASAILSQLGDTLATISAHRELISKSADN